RTCRRTDGKRCGASGSPRSRRLRSSKARAAGSRPTARSTTARSSRSTDSLLQPCFSEGDDMNDIHPQRRLAAALAVALLAMPAMAGAQEGGAVDRPVQPMPAPRPIPDLRRGSPATAPPAATRPVIGGVLAPGSRDVVIVAVTPDSPAGRAGLRTGDRLVEIGGHRLLGSTPALRADNARRLLGDLTPARAVRLAVMRGDERREVS